MNTVERFGRMAMCWSFLLVVCAASLGSADTTKENVTESPQFVVEVADGSRIIGTPTSAAFEVVASYGLQGTLTIPWQAVERMTANEDKETFMIRLQDGQQFRAALKLREIEIQTALGKLSLPSLQILTIQAHAKVLTTSVRDGLVLYYSFGRRGDTVKEDPPKVTGEQSEPFAHYRGPAKMLIRPIVFGSYEKVIDESGHGNDGKAYGARWIAEGKVGGAYEFDGANNMLEIQPNGLDDLSDATICFWINTPAEPKAYDLMVFEHRRNDDARLDLRVQGEGKGIGLCLAVDGRQVGIGNAVPTFGEWCHCAAVLGHGGMKLFVNGQLVSEDPKCILSFKDLGRSVSTTIGRTYFSRSHVGGPCWFKGKLDEFMIFNRALSADQIKQLYATTKDARAAAHEGSIEFGGVNWVPWRTLFEVQGDKLVSLPKARPGFNYGHGGNGRGAWLMTNIGNVKWKDYSVQFEYCMSGVNPGFNPYGLPLDYRGGGIMFHVVDLKESWNESGWSAYRLGLGGDGSWNLGCVYNAYCRVPSGYGDWRADAERKLAEGKGLKPDPKNGNKFRIDVRGTHIQVWVDGEKIADVRDEKMGENIGGKTLDHGGVGFDWVHDSMGWVRSFSIEHARTTATGGPNAALAIRPVSSTDPYRISTVRQLQEMQNALDAHYVLAGDIDASETAAWNSGKGFEPVGNRERPFTGCFDGQGHSIRGLRIDRFGMVTRDIGLFGYAGPSAIIRNVKLEKAYVKGCDCVGLLVGVNCGSVANCHVSGQVYGSGTFGGLLGANSAPGVVARCSAAVDVGPVWVGNHLGGLVGGNNGGRIVNCYATGTVQGQENPGGLVGVNNEGTILNCYAAGDVKSSFSGASDAYPRGAGGLVAQSLGGGKVSNCFATGQVSGPGGLPVGGIIGISMDEACLHNSYYVKRPGSPEAGVGKCLADSGSVQWEAIPEIDAAFFVPGKSPLGRWDFEKIWTLDRSQPGTAYPRFRDPVVKP